MPIFEVTLHASCLAMVEAKDKEEATAMAWEFVEPSDFEISEIDEPLEQKTETEIDRLSRHCDAKFVTPKGKYDETYKQYLAKRKT